MTESVEAQAAFEWVLRLAAMSAVIGGIEQLRTARQLGDDGLMGWQLGCLRSPVLVRGPFGSGLDLVLRYPNVLGLVMTRVLIGIVIVARPAPSAHSTPVLWLMTLIVALLTLRNPLGQDGSDQMQWIIFLGAAVASLAATPDAKTLFLWFVGLQACLAYATAGWAKAIAAGWQDGSFLAAIMSTHIYGHPRLGRLLQDHGWLSKGLSRTVIGWECTFPLLLVAPEPIALAFLGGGVMFHLANAALMGLNLFFWSFVASYPALLYCLNSRGW